MTTYDTLRIKVGRRPITVVELDLDFCTRTYGVAPCTASVGTTGTQKCFNTFGTCQSTPDYERTVNTYRFTEANSFLPIGENVFPCISDTDIAPTQLKPGLFSVSASVTISLQDFPHHDRGIDPYVDSRSYTPRDQGTFFGKLLARNPVVTNRVMRVNTGYIDADRTIYTLTRTYFIDRIEGPDASGKVKIVGKDILRFAEIDKTKVPKSPSATLQSSAPAVVTFTNTLTPSGSDYPTSGYAALDEEIVYYTRSGDSINVSGRNQENTTALAHSAGTVFRPGFPASTSSYRPVEVIRDLLLAAGIDPAYIPFSDWVAECDAYINPFSISTIFFEPESVKKLIEEVLQDYGCALWWDELDAKIKFKVISATATVVATLTDTENIVKDSVTVKVLEKERFSRIQISYGMLKSGSVQNYVSKLTPSDENMGKAELFIGTDAESQNAYGGAVLKSIASRWLGYNYFSEPTAIAARYLARYSKAPREITFVLDAKDSYLRTGDVISVVTRFLQAADGSKAAVKFLITQFSEVMVGSQYKYIALELPD